MENVKPCYVIAAVFCFLFLGLGILVPSCIFSEVAPVAQKEFSPDALLKKYMWFKDAAAALDAKKADIEVYEGRLQRLKGEYPETPRGKWPRDDREQANLWEQESAGLKASYNDLAGEYNAAMSKANWAFCNRGSLPQGADEPLPREFRTYETK